MAILALVLYKDINKENMDNIQEILVYKHYISPWERNLIFTWASLICGNKHKQVNVEIIDFQYDQVFIDSIFLVGSISIY